MFSSQDYHNQYLLAIKGIREDLKTCLHLLFSSDKFIYTEFRFDDDDIDFASVDNHGVMIIGVSILKCITEPRILQKDAYGEIYALKLEYDLTLQDFIGILERVQDKLTELSIDYKTIR